MPDARIEIEDVLGEGDRTLTRFTVYGTHRGDLFGIPASGRQVRVATLLVSRFAGARIVEEWAIKDMLGLLQQIGAIPMPEAVPAGA
jgi:predicted ester cyclase